MRHLVPSSTVAKSWSNGASAALQALAILGLLFLVACQRSGDYQGATGSGAANGGASGTESGSADANGSGSGPNRATAGGGSTGEAAGNGVILLRYTPGSESTYQREEGFLETVQNDPRIKVLSSDQYAGTTPEESLAKAQQVLQKFGGQAAGVFAVCEPNANGTLGALEELGLSGKVKLVGFDPNERMVQAMRDGSMHGIVLQDPVTMGELAVKALMAHLDPASVRDADRPRLFADGRLRKRIPTGEYLATPENMEEPRMRELLHPPQASGTETGAAGKAFRIAVIPKGTTHEFWKSVHYGALRAAEELGNVEILWQGPPLESDRGEQIKLVQNFITKKVHGICLAPLDSQALVEVVREASTNGIPTVVFDSGLDTDESEYVSYVATDNRVGGQLAGKRMAELLHAAPSAP
ncbi:MAG: D-allose-binding periplasmic protein precursor [Planctomycetota bacterium]|jgi:ABC-type sugar transport system substrate-binding protein